MENSTPIGVAPLLLRNLITTVLIFADKSLLHLADRYKFVVSIRYLLVTAYLYLLRVLPSLIPKSSKVETNFKFKHTDHDADATGGDSGVARALSQLFSILNDIPVASRKYEVVRSLADRMIDENHSENVVALRELNRSVMTAAFSRSLRQLEAAILDGGGSGAGGEPVLHRLNRGVKKLRVLGDGLLSRAGLGKEELDRSGATAEKLAAELFWLAQKMAACDFGEEAVKRWASASNLAWLALSAEPRVQGSMVKLSAFLFKQTKEIREQITSGAKKDEYRQIEVKLLISWLPLLCRSSNGTDVPVLSAKERMELEKVLEETIEMLQRDEQEMVLSLWLHHFSYCSSSDWPNLNSSYARWCTTSRKLLLFN